MTGLNGPNRSSEDVVRGESPTWWVIFNFCCFPSQGGALCVFYLLLRPSDLEVLHLACRASSLVSRKFLVFDILRRIIRQSLGNALVNVNLFTVEQIVFMESFYCSFFSVLCAPVSNGHVITEIGKHVSITLFRRFLMAIFASKSQIASTVQHTLTLFWTLRFLFFWDENFFFSGKVTDQKIDLSRYTVSSLSWRSKSTIHPQSHYPHLVHLDTFLLLLLLFNLLWSLDNIFIWRQPTKRDSTREGCSRAQLSVTTGGRSS